MTTAQRAALRALVKNRNFSTETGGMITALLDRLDTAERLLGEAVRVVEDCASAAPHETITSIRTEDARGKPVWLQAMAADLCEPIATFLAASSAPPCAHVLSQVGTVAAPVRLCLRCRAEQPAAKE